MDSLRVIALAGGASALSKNVAAEGLATLYVIWPARGLNLRSIAFVKKALPLDKY